MKTWITQYLRWLLRWFQFFIYPSHLIISILFTALMYLVFSRPGALSSVTMGPCPPVWTQHHAASQMSNLSMDSEYVKPLDCAAAFQGNEKEIVYAKQFKWCTRQDAISDGDYVDVLTANCDKFRQNFGYESYQVTPEERDFPIAFSILMHENVEQAERLLRMIYRPQNTYCIHVDLKAPQSVQKAVHAIVGCFDNVIIPKKQISVHWAEFTVLEAELVCLEALWTANAKWKYFINLTGRDFPLKTNWELVQILKAYNGANDIDGTPHRSVIVHVLQNHDFFFQFWDSYQQKLYPPPPLGARGDI